MNEPENSTNPRSLMNLARNAITLPTQERRDVFPIGEKLGNPGPVVTFPGSRLSISSAAGALTVRGGPWTLVDQPSFSMRPVTYLVCPWGLLRRSRPLAKNETAPSAGVPWPPDLLSPSLSCRTSPPARRVPRRAKTPAFRTESFVSCAATVGWLMNGPDQEASDFPGCRRSMETAGN